MYNQEWKEAYLTRNNFTESEKDDITKAFNEANILENELDNDLCKFNMPQVKKLIQSTDNKYTQLYYDYCNWCLCEAYTMYINPFELFIEDDEEEIEED